MIKEKNEIYKCEICGNMVATIHTGKGALVCCGESMKEVTANTQEDVSLEKHIPIVEKDGTTLTITVGSVEHPMDENHYIEWVEIISDSATKRRYLQPGDEPKFKIACKGKLLTVRAYCNVHGLWKNK